MTQTQTQTQTQNKGNRQDEHKPPIEILINKKGEPDLRINSREGIDILAEAVAQVAKQERDYHAGKTKHRCPKIYF